MNDKKRMGKIAQEKMDRKFGRGTYIITEWNGMNREAFIRSGSNEKVELFILKGWFLTDDFELYMIDQLMKAQLGAYAEGVDLLESNDFEMVTSIGDDEEGKIYRMQIEMKE